LHLQAPDSKVVSIDISPVAIKTCRLRGVRDARVCSITSVSARLGEFDTVLMFGNNFGLFGNPRRARWLLRRLHGLTSPTARIVAESSSVTLRIASTHALSFTFLPRWLRSLESKTTLGPVQLVSDVLQRCEALMLQSKVQFVLSHAHPRALGALDADPYFSTVVGQDQLLPVSLPNKQGKPQHRLEGKPVAQVPLLQYPDESGLGRIVRAVAGRRLEGMPVRVAFTAHLASVLRTMALDGRGIAWLPQTLVEEDIAAGRLVAAAGDDWTIPMEIRLYRERRPAGNAAEAFWSAAATDVTPPAGTKAISTRR